MRSSTSTLLLCLATCLLWACDDETTPAPTPDATAEVTPDAAMEVTPEVVGETGPTVFIDEAASIAKAIAYADGGFTKINADPISATQHATGNVNVWVTDESAALYKSIDPADATTTTDAFVEGAIIVKEHLKANTGDADGLTVMVKAAAGYNPDASDWWWARIENNGTASFSGVVDFCVGCHTPRAASDWVFGVEAADQAP